jgi:hypothetical protein
MYNRVFKTCALAVDACGVVCGNVDGYSQANISILGSMDKYRSFTTICPVVFRSVIPQSVSLLFAWFSTLYTGLIIITMKYIHI